MINEEKFTDSLNSRQWSIFCDLMGADPVELKHANLSLPFVYCRRWGVFYVGMGRHQAAMSFLLAVKLGFNSGMEAAENLKLNHPYGTAEYWMKVEPGAAFKSSVGKAISVSKLSNLSILEKRVFTLVNEID